MSKGPTATQIQQKLSAAFTPKHLQVINESGMHNVPKGSETHFKVIVVSERFKGTSLIERHRMIHSALKVELEEGGVHALSIVSKTPMQWDKSDHIQESPKCLGGMIREMREE